MELAAVLAFALLVGAGVLLWRAFVLQNRAAAYAEMQMRMLAEQAFEYLKAQSLPEKAALDIQRDIAAEILPAEQAVPEVRTTDGRVISLDGREWEVLS